ncbi:MAG: hypothetical protein Q8933_00370 [Bacteroidota bacterium]|nr:hypothetical protein [Bacteroidota bacterium]MDP4190554.1 hypothetical protein [Bacteroidota bacterium]MDP4194214.1 hypothetical protein [Bacteroidota bacterium]
MFFQAVITVIHILSAVVWLGYVPSDIVLRRQINNSRGTSGEKNLISSYLILTNVAGIIGMSGLLFTGIILVSVIPYYFFFNFASNHWLAAKQVIMVVLIILVFAFLIPKAKKLRTTLNNEKLSKMPLSDQAHRDLKNLETIISIIDVLVLLNFLFAVTHRFLT